jgi:hypothetical protein
VGVLDAVQRPGDDPGPVRVAADKANQGAPDTTGAGERFQLGAQLSAEYSVAEADRGSCQSADAQRPQVGAVVPPGTGRGRDVQGTARGVEVVGFPCPGEQPGGDGMRVRGDAHPAADRRSGRVA